MQQWHKIIAALVLFASVISYAHTQESANTSWDGVWVADGSNFALKLQQQGEKLHLEPVETLGFVWENSVGVISGESAQLTVEYQGARASIVVVKSNEGTAIAKPASCSPEFHIICALIQSQQASFTKVPQTAQRN